MVLVQYVRKIKPDLLLWQRQKWIMMMTVGMKCSLLAEVPASDAISNKMIRVSTEVGVNFTSGRRTF